MADAPEKVVVRGKEIKFKFANMENLMLAEDFGLGENFGETWEKMKKDKGERARVHAIWPEYVRAVVVDPPEEILDLRKILGMEAFKIVRGFIAVQPETPQS